MAMLSPARPCQSFGQTQLEYALRRSVPRLSHPCILQPVSCGLDLTLVSLISWFAKLLHMCVLCILSVLGVQNADWVGSSDNATDNAQLRPDETGVSMPMHSPLGDVLITSPPARDTGYLSQKSRICLPPFYLHPHALQTRPPQLCRVVAGKENTCPWQRLSFPGPCSQLTPINQGALHD
jgi:hypothetical protein